MSDPKNAVKTALTFVGLLGAVAFTYLRAFGDSDPPASRKSPAPSPPASTDRPSPQAPAAPPSQAAPAKALQWEDYLNYDPFQGRGAKHEGLFALTERPSPFFSDIVSADVRDKQFVPDPIEKMQLSAVLGDGLQRIAVIDHRSYRIGDVLLGPEGKPILDAEFGELRLSRIEADRVFIQTGGTLYQVDLPRGAASFVQLEGAKSPQSGTKTDD